MTSMPVAGLRPGPRTHQADLVVRNAKIFTGDPRRPAAGALTVTDGIIGVVGDDADVAGHIGPGTRALDALGRRVVPGLNARPGTPGRSSRPISAPSPTRPRPLSSPSTPESWPPSTSSPSTTASRCSNRCGSTPGSSGRSASVHSPLAILRCPQPGG